MEERETTRSVSLLIGDVGDDVGGLLRQQIRRRRFGWWSGGMGSVGQTNSLGGGSVAMLVNGSQFTLSIPSGPAGNVRAAPEVRASR